MSLITGFDVRANFWKMNPQFKLIDPYMSLYKADKTKAKNHSSKIMWCIVAIYDPSPENIYRNLEIDQTKEILARDFLQQPNFKWEKYKEELDFFKNQVLTPASRSLVTWEEIITKRDEAVKKFYKKAIDEEDIYQITELDKLIAATPKFFQDYNKIKQQFDEQEDSTKYGKGQRIKSLSDDGSI